MSDTCAPAGSTVSPINWHRVPLSREKLSELTQRSNWKGFLQTVSYFLLLALTGTVAYFAYAHLSLWLSFIILRRMTRRWFCPST